MSNDAAASALTNLVRIMQTLRSPGGCPWDAQQTPQSLAPYLLEETYETLEALSLGDSQAICEELGDLLLQIVFQARIFEERGEFDFKDVAEGIAEKLIRRHPHVFGSASPQNDEDLQRQWEILKGQESKHRQRSSRLLAGIPKTLPALSMAQKALGRLERRFGRHLLPEPPTSLLSREEESKLEDLEITLGDRLLELVEQCRGLHLDAEAVLRTALQRLEAQVGEPPDLGNSSPEPPKTP